MTRKITDEEKELWKIATSKVKTVQPEIDDFLESASKVKIRITPIEEIINYSKGSAAGATSEQRRMRRADGSPKQKELIEGKVNAMDGGSFRKLFQGRQKIEDTIDLHGLWLHEAHIAVRDFIESSRSQGKRCVLIITGKGGISGQGKIKNEFPKWINDLDLRKHVLSFTQSRPEHGGAGAYYVYLRK